MSLATDKESAQIIATTHGTETRIPIIDIKQLTSCARYVLTTTHDQTRFRNLSKTSDNLKVTRNLVKNKTAKFFKKRKFLKLLSLRNHFRGAERMTTLSQNSFKAAKQNQKEHKPSSKASVVNNIMRFDTYLTKDIAISLKRPKIEDDKHKTIRFIVHRYQNIIMKELRLKRKTQTYIYLLHTRWRKTHC